jgi:hypothetical protein
MVVFISVFFGFAVLGSAEEKKSKAVCADEVVAVVNRHVITRSEVWQESAVILIEQKGEKGLKREVTPQFLGRVVELYINQRLLLDEANKLGIASISSQEKDRLLELMKQQFSDHELYIRFLYKYDLSEDDLGEILARHLMVERLKERKLRTMSTIDNEQVRSYYQKNRWHFGKANLDVVAEAIKLKLLTQKREEVLKQWIRELRKRSQIKVLVDFAEES